VYLVNALDISNTYTYSAYRNGFARKKVYFVSYVGMNIEKSIKFGPLRTK